MRDLMSLIKNKLFALRIEFGVVRIYIVSRHFVSVHAFG